MSTPARLSLIERLMRDDASRREPDPADMGTAFGMEQTLDQPETDDAPASNLGPFAWLAQLLPGRRAS